MHHSRVKPKTRPQQLPGLRRHEVDSVVKRTAATNSDNSLSSSDSGGRGRAISRDSQVPVAVTTAECTQQHFLSVDSTDEARICDSYPHLRIPALPSALPHELTGTMPSGSGGAGNENSTRTTTSTIQSLNVPTTKARRRSVSLGRTSSAFSRAFDEDDAQ